MVVEVVLKVGRMMTALDVEVYGCATQSFNTRGKSRWLGSLSLEKLCLVKNKELTIFGPMRIHLNHIRASADGGLESGDGVFGMM